LHNYESEPNRPGNISSGKYFRIIINVCENDRCCICGVTLLNVSGSPFIIDVITPVGDWLNIQKVMIS
jgi:hypothetical protein